MAEVLPWEYRIEVFGSAWRSSKPEDVAAFLNELGAEGWEVINLHQPENSTKIWVTLKRPQPPAARRRRRLPGDEW